MRYFANFPKISYSNTNVIDVTRRVKVVDKSKNSPYIFYPYEISSHLRSDQIAEYYYENSFLDWLIYISNDVTDPYYDWYVRDDQLEDLIRTKYSSTIETLKRKIKFFVNNWFEHAEEEISISHYENNIARSLKKYYDPYYSDDGKIVSYRRARVDHTMNTNMVIDYTISAYNSGNSFTSGELVEIWQPGTEVGSGEVIFSNSSVVRIHSVQGNTVANTSTGTFLVGETSTTNASANSANTKITNISTEEGVYWSPMYVYDWEVMRNEQKRTIRLVDASVVPFLANEARNRLANT